MLKGSKGFGSRTFIAFLLIALLPFVVASTMLWAGKIDAEAWKFAAKEMLDADLWLFGAWAAKRVGDKIAGAKLVESAK